MSQLVRGKMPVITNGIDASDHAALMTTLDDLLLALSVHPRMADPPSSYLTPTSLFHIYDFIHRTRSNLAEIRTNDLQANDQDALERWNDCVGRCGMARLMINSKNDKTAELLGGRVEFGNKTRSAVVRAAIVARNAGYVEGAS